MPSNSKTALIIFAREPRLGKVKTRLAQEVPAKTVLRLYRAFIRDVLRMAAGVECDQRFLYYAGTGASIPFLRRHARGFQLKRQAGGDLGRRMHAAFTRCRNEGFGRSVLIGTDCLTVSSKDIERSFRKLAAHDVVFGPADDGGFYLIGARCSRASWYRGVRWGTAAVLKATLANVRAANGQAWLLPPKDDIDTLPSLRKFAKKVERGHFCPYTKGVLNSVQSL